MFPRECLVPTPTGHEIKFTDTRLFANEAVYYDGDEKSGKWCPGHPGTHEFTVTESGQTAKYRIEGTVEPGACVWNFFRNGVRFFKGGPV